MKNGGKKEGRKEEGRVVTELDVHSLMIKIFLTDSSCVPIAVCYKTKVMFL